jgi:aminopeptidase-like protein
MARFRLVATVKQTVPGVGPAVQRVGAEGDAEEMTLQGLVAQLYPICRSITGDGVRQTLGLIGRHIELERHEIPSGKAVFDWETPLEWNIDDACVLDGDGRRVIDFRQHNLHVLNYSEPVRRQLSLADLRGHLHSMPDRPDWIPYRTSYYRRQWGFCLRHSDLASLAPGKYEARIDSRLEPGSLTYGEWFLPGRSRAEVLLFAHVCHPSLANDNVSGMAIATLLAKWLAGAPRRYSYRLVLAPGTIGSLCWLKVNEARLSRIAHGLVLGLLGDPASFTYKMSRRGDSEIDRVVPYVLRARDPGATIMPFEAYGYDERQFCSPGFNLPMGRLTRSVNDGYPEYHSSADNLQLITTGQMLASLATLKAIVEVLEGNRRYVNLAPKGEPRLGKRGLYGATGGRSPADRERAMLWVLNQSDGGPSLLDIAERSGIGFADTRLAADELSGAGLLRGVGEQSRTRPARAVTRRPGRPRKKASKGVRR